MGFVDLAGLRWALGPLRSNWAWVSVTLVGRHPCTRSNTPWLYAAREQWAPLESKGKNKEENSLFYIRPLSQLNSEEVYRKHATRQKTTLLVACFGRLLGRLELAIKRVLLP